MFLALKPTVLARRIWNSPALTTGASFAARSLNSALILWLALGAFTAEEVIVWQLIGTIIAMQLLMDLGLTPTFTRLFAFAIGGEAGKPNWKAVAEVWGTVVWIYRRLTIAATILMVALGSLALIRPVSALAEPGSGWIAWVVVLVVSPFTFGATPYAIYLQGLNEVATLRRWETLTSVGAIVASLIVLLSGGRVVALAVNYQFWAIISAWRNRRMAFAAADGRLKEFTSHEKSSAVFDAAWPAAWRSGVGVIIAAGFVQLTGIVYAQIGAPLAVAAYLVALRFVSVVNQFSQAPFYSKLPMLAQLHAQGKIGELITTAQRGMRLSLWTYVVAVSVLAFALKPALALMRSAVAPPPAALWWLLAAAFFAERFGAMHLQLYSLTNHIVWHIVNGVSGAISLVAVVVLYPLAGVYAFPLSLLAGYCGFYGWYCAHKVYVAFQVPFLRFEKSVGIAAVAGLFSAVMLQWVLA